MAQPTTVNLILNCHWGDWTCYDLDDYDCDCDQDGFFSDSPMGHGKSDIAAILDFFEDRTERRAAA